ncbi:MAG: 16S rRNA (cytidine(1402)-2'-O)-methyltransferase [Bacteroidales bacterium]|nr:16S rRNA (cytidine(1402)-2'-O)-methyltransferase [Bacteroidales bacterium]
MIVRELNYEGSSPLLYLVATPIGNLGEFTPRAIDILKQMDFVACEDTRNSGLLLQRFSINKPLISCHEHNEESASDKIIALLKGGKKVAYVSDAGYPVVSDPGNRLAKRCLKEGIKVAVVNGPNAGICALVGSGLDAEHFYFYGFLPAKSCERKAELQTLASLSCTLVFYESPHRIKAMLIDVKDTLGGERPACLCRELTKAHEEYIHGTLAEIAALDEVTLIGEMVLVVSGASKTAKELSDADIAMILKEKLVSLSGKDAVKEVAKENAIPKNRVYSIYLSLMAH